MDPERLKRSDEPPDPAWVVKKLDALIRQVESLRAVQEDELDQYQRETFRAIRSAPRGARRRINRDGRRISEAVISAGASAGATADNAELNAIQQMKS